MSHRRILLLGKNGQLGWELQRSLAPLGQLIALDRAGLSCEAARAQGLATGNSTLSGDLTDFAGLTATVQQLAPQVIVNAAAYTAVDAAQTHGDMATCVNAHAPGVLARAAKTVGAVLVHYSTDYVFDGSGTTAWKETDDTHPCNVYGQTKRAGEQAIMHTHPWHMIFRTSWVYGAHGKNFAKTIVRAARERSCLEVVADQFGAPTGVELIADVTAHAIRHILETGKGYGIYHLAAAGVTSWHGYAAFILQQLQQQASTHWKMPQLKAVSSAHFPALAPRPKNSRLATKRCMEAFGLHLPAWQLGVARMLAEISEPLLKKR